MKQPPLLVPNPGRDALHQLHRPADVIKKILEHLGLWEKSQAPPDRNQGKKVITFDPSYSQLI
jgi:hypothetical protein